MLRGVIEHHSSRLIHFNVTAHPTALWTRQQLREAVGYEERYAYLLHDRDSIFSTELDESIQRLGLRVLKSPPRGPKANAICERVIGTLRRECLDCVPDPPANSIVPLSTSRHRLEDFRSVHAKAILGGLHHDYSLARA